MEYKKYTTGELAKLTGVSYKTIRHYCEKGLLNPVQYKENGYKLFDHTSVETLQKILVLKYLHFPLPKIKTLLYEKSTKDYLVEQEKILKGQLTHMEQVLHAVQEVKKLGKEQYLDQMISIIHMTQNAEEIIKQYIEGDNLQKRINIHSYSTSKVNWYQWVLDGLHIEEGMKILEIGCGNGMFWKAISKQLPSHLRIILSDRSSEMVDEARNQLKSCEAYFKENDIVIEYLVKDGEEFHMEEKEFDRIIANHMLYHISDENRQILLQQCATLLKKDGMFYASTVGRTHMKELLELAHEFDAKLEPQTWVSAGFELENGEEQLKKVFGVVKRATQQNDLLVPDPQAVYDYIYSLPGNAKEILEERKEECMKYLQKKISKEHPFFIHKSLGAFTAYR